MVASVVIDRQHFRQTAPFASLHSSRLFSFTLSMLLYFEFLTDIPTQRPLLTPFAINSLRTLFISTGGVLLRWRCLKTAIFSTAHPLLPIPYPNAPLSPFRIHTYKNRYFARFSCHLNPFRINTSKSVSKQMTLTTFRMNTYEKQGEGGSSYC